MVLYPEKEKESISTQKKKAEQRLHLPILWGGEKNGLTNT